MSVLSTRIFISYSSEENRQATEIHAFLEEEGFVVWRDQSGLTSETNWKTGIGKALANKTDIVCLLWSQNSCNSHWVKHEILTARALGKPILPLLFEGSPALPKIIQELNGIVLNQNLFEYSKIKEYIIKLATSGYTYDYDDLPEVPYNYNSEFVGRELEFISIYNEQIKGIDKKGNRRLGLVGMGGVGKTQLAIQFAYRFSYIYDKRVYWLDASNSSKWKKQFIEIARDKIGLTIQSEGIGNFEDRILTSLKRYFTENHVLILMDNVDDPNLLNNKNILSSTSQLTPLSMGCDLIFSTRKHFTLPDVSKLVLDVLYQGGKELLTQKNTAKNEEQQYSAKRICELVGYLPLALVMINALLRKYTHLSYSDYLAELSEYKLETIDTGEISEDELATKHEAAIGATLKSQWKRLKNDDRWAQDIFKILGLFKHNSIVPKARLKLLLPDVPGQKKLIAPLSKAFYTLNELCLVSEIGRRNELITLHPLITDFINKYLLTPENAIAIKDAAALNLYQQYRHAAVINKNYLSRSIDAILEDIKTGIRWSIQNSMHKVFLDKIGRILERERSHLNFITYESVLNEILHYSTTINEKDKLHVSCNELRYLINERSESLKRRVGNIIFDSAIFSMLIGVINHIEKTNDVLQLRDRLTLELNFLLDDTSKDYFLENGEKKLLHAAFLDPYLKTRSQLQKSRTPSPSFFQQIHIRASSMNLPDMATDYYQNALETTGLILKSISQNKFEDTSIIRSFPSGGPGWYDTVCVSQNGKYAVSSALASTLYYWEIETGELINVIEFKEKRSITAICFGKSDYHLIIGFKKGYTSIYNLKESTEIERIDVHTDKINYIVHSTHRQCFYTCSNDNTVAQTSYDGIDSKILTRLSDQILFLDLVLDDNKLIMVTDIGDVIKWDIDSAVIDETFHTEIEMQSSKTISVTADGSLLLITSRYGKEILLYDLKSKKRKKRIKIKRSSVDALCLNSNGSTAISCHSDSKIRVWDLSDKVTARKLKGHTDQVTDAVLLSDSKQLLSCARDRAMILWDLHSIDSPIKISVKRKEKDVKKRSKISAPSQRAKDTSQQLQDLLNLNRTFHTDNTWKTPSLDRLGPNISFEERLKAISDDLVKQMQDRAKPFDDILQDINSFDAANDREAHIYRNRIFKKFAGKNKNEDDFMFNIRHAISGARKITAVDLSEDGSVIANAFSDGGLELWYPQKKNKIHLLQDEGFGSAQLISVQFSTNGKKLTASTASEFIETWNVQELDSVHQFNDDWFHLLDISLSYDLQRALCGFEKGTLQFYDVNNKKLLFSLEGHTDRLISLDMSLNERVAISSSLNETIFWDLHSQKKIGTIENHDGMSTLSRVNRDGSVGITVNPSKHILVWDIEQQEIIARFEGHWGRITGLSFVNRDKHVVSSSDDGTLMVWDISKKSALHRAFFPNPITCLAAKDKYISLGDAGGFSFLLEIIGL